MGGPTCRRGLPTEAASQASRPVVPVSPRPQRPPPAIPSPTPATPAPVPPSPEPEPGEAPLPAADPDGELPEVFRERIRALGKRKRAKPLRVLILEICAYREWTTVGQLSEWLGMDTSNLQRRHLRPMLKSGRLRLRYPDSRSHPEQGYRATGV